MSMGRRTPNVKVTVQAMNADLVNFVRHLLLEELGVAFVLETGIRNNTREPFLEGKHTVVFFLVADPVGGEAE